MLMWMCVFVFVFVFGECEMSYVSVERNVSDIQAMGVGPYSIGT